MTKPIKAKIKRITAVFHPQHEIDEAKVDALEQFLLGGGEVPPPVVVQYKGWVLPLDGHHRLAAHARLGRDLDAWVVSGRTFNNLEQTVMGAAEDYIICGNKALFDVAPKWPSPQA